MTNQQNISRPKLVFWLDYPPHSAAGSLKYVAETWGEPVYFLCAQSMREERKALGWGERHCGRAGMISLEEKKDISKFLKAFVQKHHDSIHVGNGFRGPIAKYTKKYLFTNPGLKIAMWSEPPGVYESPIGKFAKWLMIPLMYRYYAHFYGPKIQLYMPLGTLGVEAFCKFNWDRNILFPFMYSPQIFKSVTRESSKMSQKPLRFLYVGQFTWRKGVDVLLGAFDKEICGDWRLDIVGRNGDYEKKIIGWAHKNPKVSYLGVWSSHEVVQKIKHYDICLVPSRFDGWGLVTNESILAGVGVIGTDGAASHDLIKASDAGKVIPAGDVVALHKVIQQVIDNPALVDNWKVKAQEYAPKISSESVGRYLMDVLEYTFLDPSQPRPQCPWL